MHRFSVEDLATLTDEEALKRRFDAHNLRLLRFLLWGFLVVSVAQIPVALESGSATHSGVRPAVALVNLALVGFLIPVLGRVVRGCVPTRLKVLDALARRVGRFPRGFVLGYLVVQFVLLAAFTFLGESREPWFFAYGFVLLFFRLAATEVVFLYASIFLTALLEALVDALQGGAGFDSDLLPAVAISCSVLLILALGNLRRARKAFLAEWLEERERAREQIRMRQELEFAREIQVSMLPDRDPAPGWLEVAGVSLPATEVGGDYYDYFTTGGGKLAVVVGDVAGHGLASGLVLSGVRSCLTLLAEELDHPGAVLVKLHRMLQATSRHRMFVTLAILLLDRERSRAVLTSAGHPPLLIRRADGTVEEVLLPALPLGAALQSRFEEREIGIGPGDVLVLHTDGIYEAVDAAGASYGLARLAAVLGRAGAGGSAAALRDEVLRDLSEFRGRAAQDDDVTLVVIRVAS